MEAQRPASLEAWEEISVQWVAIVLLVAPHLSIVLTHLISSLIMKAQDTFKTVSHALLVLLVMTDSSPLSHVLKASSVITMALKLHVLLDIAVLKAPEIRSPALLEPTSLKVNRMNA